MPRRKYYQADKEKWRAYNRAYLRKWRLAHPKRASQYETHKKYIEEPEHYRKHIARVKLRDAVKSGKVVKTGCENGKDCYGRIEGHHFDYSKPLEVEWLCVKHHKEKHDMIITLTLNKRG